MRLFLLIIALYLVVPASAQKRTSEVGLFGGCSASTNEVMINDDDFKDRIEFFMNYINI
jgi:hypothetical protein